MLRFDKSSQELKIKSRYYGGRYSFNQINTKFFMKITIDDKFSYFEIKLGFKEKITSFHGSFEKVPISKVKSVSNDIPKRSWKDMKMPGTDLPGFRAGSFTTTRGHEFWYAHFKKESNYLVIELTGDTYDRIILTVDNNIELKEKFDKLLENR